MNDEALIIPIVALLIPLVVVPTSMVVKHLHRRREWQHAERMRALDLGHAPAAGSLFWPSMAALAIGAGVPIVTFGVAWLAVLTGGAETEVFIAATFVGLGAIVVGGRLASQMLQAARSTPPNAPRYPDYPAVNGAKPSVEPDSFDVVSRRG